jgi:hypothetical protein
MSLKKALLVTTCAAIAITSVDGQFGGFGGFGGFNNGGFNNARPPQPAPLPPQPPAVAPGEAISRPGAVGVGDVAITNRGTPTAPLLNTSQPLFRPAPPPVSQPALVPLESVLVDPIIPTFDVIPQVNEPIQAIPTSQPQAVPVQPQVQPQLQPIANQPQLQPNPNQPQIQPFPNQPQIQPFPNQPPQVRPISPQVQPTTIINPPTIHTAVINEPLVDPIPPSFNTNQPNTGVLISGVLDPKTGIFTPIDTTVTTVSNTNALTEKEKKMATDATEVNLSVSHPVDIVTLSRQVRTLNIDYQKKLSEQHPDYSKYVGKPILQ